MNKQEIDRIRQDFPILNQTVQDEPLIYFDNAATSQSPQTVIDQLVHFYQKDRANAHRGVHTLGQRATDLYEGGREKIAEFIGAQSPDEVAFTSGTTDSLNRIARGLVEPRLEAGDILLTTYLEPHSNLVPWQDVCQRTGAHLHFMPLDASGQIDLAALEAMDTHRVKAIVTHHVSNVLGVHQPIQALGQWARDRDILLIIDGAQAVAHLPLDLANWQIDAYAFSSHKIYGPMGLGVTYLNHRHLSTTQPVNYGGEMIHQVWDDHASYQKAPWKFEAGTQAISQVVGLAAAIDWISQIGFPRIQEQEARISRRLYRGLSALEGVTLYTPEASAANGILSFNLEGIHPHDAATAYDQLGIALRAGHHCAQPLMRQLEVPATLRASLMVYNTQKEVDRFIQASQEVKEYFTYGT